jgi:hypothetical protein
MSEQTTQLQTLDPNQDWWVCWRIKGDVCGRTLTPCKTVAAVEIAEKSAAIYGEKNVWLEAVQCSS